jgi:hypothetical protein
LNEATKAQKIGNNFPAIARKILEKINPNEDTKKTYSYEK